MENNIYLEPETAVQPETWSGNNISSNIFNSAICASAIAAATEVGLLQSIRKNKTVNITDFCVEHYLQEYPFKVFLKALESFEIVSFSETMVEAGNNFDEIFSTKGYFTWLVKGYSHTLENMDLLLKAPELRISNVKRNGGYIAKAGKDYGDKYVNAYFNELFEKISPKVIADFGCGSADRLIRIIKKNPKLKGIGLDINPQAVEVARENIKAAGVEDKIEIICSDISAIVPTGSYKEVDMIFSFFMGHDLWPKENCKQIFTHITEVFPNARNFLLCDTYKSEELTNFPVFTLGFELTHAFMGQVIPTYSQWLELFSDLNWTLLETVDIGIPYSTIFNIKIR